MLGDSSTILALAAILTTSALSGVLGMGGGIILMGVFTALLPVREAMLLHGVTQLTSNAARAILHRRHIRHDVLRPYLLGAIGAAGLLAGLRWLPDAAMIYLLLGALPFLGLCLPRGWRLDITRPLHAAGAGVVVGGVQLLAGASGPVLDLFFYQSRLDKLAVVATKALTQTASHALKLVFYSAWVDATPLAPGAAPVAAADAVPFLIYPLAIGLALVGTQLGGRALQHISQTRFQRWSRVAILVIAAYYLFRGVRSLI